eukprot:5265594-Pyramimonas_sp.AAC.1
MPCPPRIHRTCSRTFVFITLAPSTHCLPSTAALVCRRYPHRVRQLRPTSSYGRRHRVLRGPMGCVGVRRCLDGFTHCMRAPLGDGVRGLRPGRGRTVLRPPTLPIGPRRTSFRVHWR